MKRLFLIILFLLSLSVTGLSQSNPPLKIKEVDGSPSQTNATELIFPNGTLTRSGSRITFSISGGGFVTGSGTSGRVAYWSGSAVLTSDAGLVWDAVNGRLGVQVASPTSIFQVDSLKPATVATTPGTDGTELMRIGNSNSGGDTSIATTGVGGLGGAITISTSLGGRATAAATSSTGGIGGTLNYRTGAGGAASVAGTGTNTGGAGGPFSILSGAGGAATGNSSGTNTGGAGGSVAVQGGTGGAANTGSGTNVAGTGGAITVTGGSGGLGTTGGTGGAVTVSGGSASSSTTPGNGGAVTIRGGSPASAAGSNGGAVSITGRDGSSTGNGGAGGNISINGGNAAGAGNNAGGIITLTPGTATGSGTGGDINIAGSRAILTFTGPVTAPAAATDKTRLWSQDAAAGDNNLYAINEVGKNERLTGLTSRVSTQFDSTNQTPANITGLTFNVEASKIYSFEGNLFTTSDVNGGVNIEISGTATATAIVAEVLITNSGLTSQGRVSALDSGVGVTAVTAAFISIKGTITVNAAGTLTLQASRNAATGTTSVLIGSYFKLVPQGN
jgi:hypothetical protein